jgi:hypothetical protein
MIERLLTVARRIADASDPLGIEARAGLVATSGLSREGIELALTEHLETSPSDEEITALLASVAAPRPRRCHVVIAANVCTGAHRAIAVALATSPAVVVRPSSRDPVLAELFVRELRADTSFWAAGGSIDQATDVRPAPGDELHVYGSDATVESLRAASGPSVIVRGYGTGLGIAAVGLHVSEREAARALTRDVIPFDQRGCLSPRAVLVEGSPSRAVAFCEALHEELGAAEKHIPRGELDRSTHAELAMYRASIEAIGRLYAGPGHAVGLDLEPRGLLLPPAARALHVVPASPASVSLLLAAWARYVTAVGVGANDDGALTHAILAEVPGARLSPLGRMQKPPFNGPVDRRSK